MVVTMAMVVKLTGSESGQHAITTCPVHRGCQSGKIDWDGCSGRAVQPCRRLADPSPNPIEATKFRDLRAQL